MVAFEAGLVLLALVAIASYAGITKGKERAIGLVIAGAGLYIAGSATAMVAGETLVSQAAGALVSLAGVLNILGFIAVLIGALWLTVKQIQG